MPGNRLWHNNIVDALRDLEHEVLLFDFPELDAFYRHGNTAIRKNRRWIEARRPRLEAALLNQIDRLHRQKPIDAFLSYFYNAHARPEVIRQIRDKGIRTLNWYCNASYQFELVREIAPAFDVSLVPERDRLDDYRAIGAHPVYCQEAANPRFYSDLGLPRDLGVVFVGQRYATREELCVAVHQAGIPIGVWGAGWSMSGPGPVWKRAARETRRWTQHLLGQPVLPPKVCHGPVSDQAMVRLYNRARIVLGFGVVSAPDYRHRPRYQIRLRDFEAPMCGAFYLMEHQDEIAEFFRVGSEIETFRSREELLDKVRYYWSHGDERDRIRRAGYERARSEHTWQRRLQSVLNSVAS